MQFKSIFIVLALAVSSLAAPVSRRAAAAVLTKQTYNDFQVSDGVAGNALAEVNAKFPVDLTDLKNVAASDLDIIAAAADLSEQAEVATGGFNDAIAAAGGTKSTAGVPLQVGKIKNKVLKLQTDVLRLMIKQAQGDTTVAAQLAAQQKKLATNVALDVKSKGQKSTAISFAGSD